ncbi:MAG: hypothetical protein AABX10_03790 [Nanoarchaeota archaeon]
MRKNLATLGALLSLGACSTTQYLNSPYVKNSMGSRNQNQIGFDLYLANVAGSWYGIKKADVVKPNEWIYTGDAVTNSRLRESRSAGTIDLESKTNSIFVPIKWDRDGDGKPEDEVTFAMTGAYGTKAEVNLPELKGLAGVATLKPKNVKSFVPTPFFGEEHQIYTIILRNERGDELGTLISPAEEAIVLTDLATGEISLRNPGKIYLWTEKNRGAYDKERNEYLEQQKAVEAASRQAAEDLRKLEELRVKGLIIPSVIVPDQKLQPQPEPPKQDPPK